MNECVLDASGGRVPPALLERLGARFELLTLPADAAARADCLTQHGGRVRGAVTLAVGAAKRLRPRTRTPEEIAARRQHAAYLRLQRHRAREAASRNREAARMRQAREAARAEYEQQQRLHAEREILDTVRREGCWFPSDRSVFVPFGADEDGAVGSWRR